MSKPAHYCMEGHELSRAPYHYTECGLDNIYLLNGFTWEEYDGEKYISVSNVDGLWKVIALDLVTTRKVLDKREIRFLRHHLKMTQADLADILRVSDQTVARWEKGHSEMPGPADLLLRCVVLASPVTAPEGKEILNHLVDRLREITSQDEDRAPQSVFQMKPTGWSGPERRVAA